MPLRLNKSWNALFILALFCGQVSYMMRKDGKHYQKCQNFHLFRFVNSAESWEEKFSWLCYQFVAVVKKVFQGFFLEISKMQQFCENCCKFYLNKVFLRDLRLQNNWIHEQFSLNAWGWNKEDMSIWHQSYLKLRYICILDSVEKMYTSNYFLVSCVFR